MGIPIFFVFFLVFLLFFNIKIHQTDTYLQKKREAFYEEERKALSVRKKSLDDLDFIKINIDKLPFINNCDIKEDIDKKTFNKQSEILRLAKLPMASFRNMSNTDLKFKYGIANFNTLINYEATYNNLLNALVEWAELLLNADKIDEAIKVLEEGIRLNTDISKNYSLLKKIYNDYPSKMIKSE